MSRDKTIRSWMLETMAREGLSGNAWARLARVAPSTVTRAIRPDSDFEISLTTLKKLASVVSVPPPLALDAPVARAKVSGCPVRGKVAAGMYQEHWADGFDADAADLEQVPVALSGYPPGLLYALKLDGTSMNRAFPNLDTYVIVCPYGKTAVGDGDFVIAERHIGGLVEATCKRLVLAGDRWELHPDSEDPAHQTALPLDGDAIIISGVVVGSWVPRVRPGVMFEG